MKFLELVEAKNDPGFDEWVASRPELPEADEYRSGLLMGFLGVGLRSYQYWEANHEALEYPAPDPARRPLWAGSEIESRFYTLQQVADVAYWFYRRRVKSEDDLVLESAAGAS